MQYVTILERFQKVIFSRLRVHTDTIDWGQFQYTGKKNRVSV